MTANKIQPKSKKMNKEAIWTLIGLFTLSAISAAYVINFRMKMKKFQVTPQEAEQVLKEEKEFQKTQVTRPKLPLEE